MVIRKKRTLDTQQEGKKKAKHLQSFHMVSLAAKSRFQIISFSVPREQEVTMKPDRDHTRAEHTEEKPCHGNV